MSQFVKVQRRRDAMLPVAETGASAKAVCSNILELIHARVKDRNSESRSRRNSEQKKRRLTTALLDLEPRLRRVKSYGSLPLLRQALK